MYTHRVRWHGWPMHLCLLTNVRSMLSMMQSLCHKRSKEKRFSKLDRLVGLRFLAKELGLPNSAPVVCYNGFLFSLERLVLVPKQGASTRRMIKTNVLSNCFQSQPHNANWSN